MTNPTTPQRLTKAELDALPLYAAVLCVDQKYQRVYLALKVGNPPGTGGHTWRTTDYATIPDSGRLAGHYAVLLDPGLTALLLMGLAQDATLAAASVKPGALTGTDQASDVVHARHEPDVVHSRHDSARDIPSSENRPATTQAVADDVAAERIRQDEKWGVQNHPDGTGPDTLPLRGLIPAGGEIRPPARWMAERAKSLTDTAANTGTLTWRHILLEEVFEALAEDDAERLRTELVQVAAVAQQWVEAIDRRVR